MDYPPNFAGMRKRILKTEARFFPNIRRQRSPIGAISPSRNRIISGLSAESPVIEAPKHSGAFFDYRGACAEQNRLFSLYRAACERSFLPHESAD